MAALTTLRRIREVVAGVAREIEDILDERRGGTSV
jgi:hypothetical protein